MKYAVKFSLVTLALSTAFAFAQETPTKDFGDLLPENNFSITQEKTALKDNADISHYEIKVNPKKEEFIYKVNSIRTPRRFLKRNGDFKLTVDRADGKVKRISSVDYASSEDATGAHGVQTVALGTDGKLDSMSNCYQEYGFGFLNRKVNKSDFKCVTINRDVCSYLEKNEIDEVLIEKINACSDMLSKFSEHQGKLKGLTKYDHMSNMKALKEVDGKLSKVKNFYEVSPKTLKDVSRLVEGYGRAVAQCKDLKEKDYLRSEPEVEVSSDTDTDTETEPDASEQ